MTTKFPPSQEYQNLMKGWRLPRDLLGGTRRMRAQHEEYLPKWPKETNSGYEQRVDSAVLYNAFRRTVRMLSAKPFTREIKVEVPKALDFVKNCDRCGTPLHSFARSLLIDSLSYGLHHVIVDMPALLAENRKEEKDLDIRPYFSRIDPTSIIRWIYVEEGGDSKLDELWIRHYEVEYDEAKREDVEYEYVKVWRRDFIRFYRRKNEGNEEAWEQVGEDIPNELGEIPLVTGYSEVSKLGDMAAESPLEDLAHLNLRHFQSQSEQDTGLHWARVPFLFFKGFKDDKIDKIIASDNAIAGPHNSDVKWIEPMSGKALELGSKDLEALEDRMDVMGADLLVVRSGNITATGRAIDAAEKVSDLQAMTLGLALTLERCYEMAAKWKSISNPEIEVDLHTEFGLTLKDKAELDFLLKSRLAGELSRPMFLSEIKRRGITDDFNVEDEIDEIAKESPLPPLGEDEDDT